jgi:hypothetical protein
VTSQVQTGDEDPNLKTTEMIKMLPGQGYHATLRGSDRCVLANIGIMIWRGKLRKLREKPVQVPPLD